MSTYNDQLQQAVLEVLTDLQNQQKAMESEIRTAQYKLYYAQGAEITARDKLKTVVQAYANAEQLDSVGVQNDNLASNLLASATECEKCVAATVTKSATAASNVQIASKAVAQLAADIGSAFNIVSAADYTTYIYRMTVEANEMIVDTAYSAEGASRIAMEATTASSEITATQVLADAKSAKADVEKLMQVTEAEFSKLATARAIDKKKADVASRAEHDAAGALKDAQCEYEAIEAAAETTSKDLNFSLTVTPSSDSIVVTFSPFEVPFKSSPDFPVPDPGATNYLIIVLANKQTMFSLEKAEKLFVRQGSQANDQSSGKKAHRLQSCMPIVDTIKLIPNDSAEDEIEYADSDGDPIKPGTSYVAFLYIVRSLSYKKFTNNYDDLLSAPSQPFILTTTLAGASDIDKKDANTITFTAKQEKVFAIEVEYRCMFLPTNTSHNDKFVAGGGVPKDIKFYFNLAIAEHVTAANYVAVRSTDAESTEHSVSIEASTTDNFGNLIDQNTAYRVAVISIVPASVKGSANYQSNLAFSSQAIHLFS